MNLRKIFETIRDYSKQIDPNVGNVIYGDVYSLNHLQTIEYPAIVVTSGQHNGNINDLDFAFRFNIFYVERLVDNNENKIDIHANAINFLNGLLRYLDDVFIVQPYEINCFNERFNDMCAGAYVNVTISVPINQCYEIIDIDKDHEKYLDGWIFDKRLNMKGEIEELNCCITNFYGADELTNVYYYIPYSKDKNINLGIWTYDENNENGEFLRWADKIQGVHFFTMPENTSKFRISFYKDYVDDIWIKNSDGKFIFKGKNIN